LSQFNNFRHFILVKQSDSFPKGWHIINWVLWWIDNCFVNTSSHVPVLYFEKKNCVIQNAIITWTDIFFKTCAKTDQLFRKANETPGQMCFKYAKFRIERVNPFVWLVDTNNCSKHRKGKLRYNFYFLIQGLRRPRVMRNWRFKVDCGALRSVIYAPMCAL
jgi:hypothetical protein